jgi:hypothetical protein
VEDGEQRRPLLEEDVDHLIRDQTRRGLERDDALGMGRGCFRSCAEEDCRVDIGGQSACLLCFLREGLCRTLGYSNL